MMKIIESSAFKKAYKKMHPTDRKETDAAIQEILKTPDIGQAKKANLKGIRVHKFKINNQLRLLAYFIENDRLFLSSVGSHENFYRDLSH